MKKIIMLLMLLIALTSCKGYLTNEEVIEQINICKEAGLSYETITITSLIDRGVKRVNCY